jgi:hypothetical protein
MTYVSTVVILLVVVLLLCCDFIPALSLLHFELVFCPPNKNDD